MYVLFKCSKQALIRINRTYLFKQYSMDQWTHVSTWFVFTLAVQNRAKRTIFTSTTAYFRYYGQTHVVHW